MHPNRLIPIVRLIARIRSGILLTRRSAEHTIQVRIVRWEPVAILLALILIQTFLPARVWLALLIGFAALLLTCIGWAMSIAGGVRLERRLLHTWVQVGDRLEEVFTLVNDSAAPLLAAEIEDGSDIPGYEVSTVRAAPPHDRYSWRQHGRSTRRGVYHLGPTTLRSGDPLGLLSTSVEYPNVREVLVFPPVLPDLTLDAPVGGGQGAAASRQRSLEETAAIGGLRDYRPGDPIRRIHWPRSERHQRFLVKEFDREMGGDIWLALDLDAPVQAGAGDASTLEYGVIWAASLAWRLLRQGRAVGLFAYGPRRLLIPPAAGSGHLWNLLRALAPVEPQSEMPLETLLGEVQPYLGRGSSLILLTPSTRPGWLEKLAQPALRSAVKRVLLFDAATFDPRAGETGSAAGVHALLSDLGITSQVISYQPDLIAQPAAPGTGDWDFVTTPLGGVVVRSRPVEARP